MLAGQFGFGMQVGFGGMAAGIYQVPMGGAGFLQMQMLNQLAIGQQVEALFQILQTMAARSQQASAQQQAQMAQVLQAYMGGAGAGGGLPWAGRTPAPPPPAAPLTQPGPPTGRTQRFIEAARAKTGKPYVFGAAGPRAYDCSGLIYAALREAGVNVPRLAARGYQAKYANHKVSRDQLEPGDLLFFHYPNNRGIPARQASHIEIYLGNGMSMGTDNPREGARAEPVDWKHFIGGARVPALQA